MPQIDIMLRNRGFHELNPVIFGWQDCPAYHSYGFTTRPHYLIHYVVSGSGTYIVGDSEYPVSAGQIFIIRPYEPTKYLTYDDPWTYIWIGFDGLLADRFSSLPLVTHLNSDIFIEMKDTVSSGVSAEEFLTGKLFELYSVLFSNEVNTSAGYTETVRNFIDNNYMTSLSVEAIAESMNLDRRYLSRVFKRDTGQTVSQYILSVRMKHAAFLLSKGFSVRETAVMVGYSDQFVFSKAFKKHTGITPQKLKNSNN